MARERGLGKRQQDRVDGNRYGADVERPSRAGHRKSMDCSGKKWFIGYSALTSERLARILAAPKTGVQMFCLPTRRALPTDRNTSGSTLLSSAESTKKGRLHSTFASGYVVVYNTLCKCPLMRSVYRAGTESVLEEGQRRQNSVREGSRV